MLDLSVGNPECLQDHWDQMKWPQFLGMSVSSYPNPEGTAELKEAIIELHAMAGNVDHLGAYEVVVGVGASQLMQAALASFAEQNKQTYVYANSPYFSRFPSYVKMSGNQTFKFTSDLGLTNNERTIELVTLPNNPDNRPTEAKTKSSMKVYDCSYLWPQYSGARLPNPQPPIMVFSLAKALGLANLRIGWALVKDKEIAKKMQKFVEIQGGGLSMPSQVMACAAILEELEWVLPSIKIMGDILEQRWKRVKEIFKNIKSVKLVNWSGMFMWLECEEGADRLVAHLGIKGALGPEFGASRHYVRYNMACRNSHFEILVARLSELG